LNIRFILLIAVCLALISACKECEECNNLYYEPKIGVVFWDKDGVSTDSIKIFIKSFNGRTDLYQREDSVARFYFPLRMDSTTTSYSIDYTAFRYKDTLVVRESSGVQDSATIKVPYEEEKIKKFTVSYSLFKKFYNDRYLFSGIMQGVNSADAKDSITLSCSGCDNGTAIIQIYEKKNK
jgi:hypothetical protein